MPLHIVNSDSHIYNQCQFQAVDAVTETEKSIPDKLLLKGCLWISHLTSSASEDHVAAPCMLTHGLPQLHWLLLRRCRNSRKLQHLRASLDVPRATW